jgi:hypothetical protein
MNRNHLIILSIVIIIFSFLEVIVFDEEVLLAMCFVCFVFFAYSYLNNTIYSLFEDRSMKIEQDLLLSFEMLLTQKFEYSSKLLADKALTSKLKMFEELEANRFASIKAESLFKLQSFIYNQTAVLLADSTTIEKSILLNMQQKKLECSVYPFVYSSKVNYMLALNQQTIAK